MRCRSPTVPSSGRWRRGSAYVYSSAAISNGTVYVGAPNGVLFALQPGGGSWAASRIRRSSLPLRDRRSPIRTAPDAGVRDGDRRRGRGPGDGCDSQPDLGGQWWNATAQAWSRVYQESPATLTDPDGTSTSWTFTFPVPYGGGSMAVEADALDTDGQRDPVAAESVFDVPGLGNPPDTTITTPVRKQIFHFPLNGDGTINHTPFYIDISGTATDSGGRPSRDRGGVGGGREHPARGVLVRAGWVPRASLASTGGRRTIGWLRPSIRRERPRLPGAPAS